MCPPAPLCRVVSCCVTCPTLSPPPPSVHLKVAEKLSLVAGRDGGLQSMEVLGLISLRISDAELGRVQVAISNHDSRPIQFQVREGEIEEKEGRRGGGELLQWRLLKHLKRMVSYSSRIRCDGLFSQLRNSE